MGEDGDWYGFDAYTIARRLTMGLVAKLLVGGIGRDQRLLTSSVNIRPRC